MFFFSLDLEYESGLTFVKLFFATFIIINLLIRFLSDEVILDIFMIASIAIS